MFITRCVPDLDALPAECAGLFAAADNFFTTTAWWRSMLADGMPDRAEACFLLCTDEGSPVAIFPLQRLEGGRELQSLTNPYTCLWQPLFAAGLDAAAIGTAGEAFGRFCRRWPVVRLEALAEDFPPLAPLLAGIRRQGLFASRYLHFGNWYEPVGGRSWEQYLAGRPGALRETVRRKFRRAQATLEIVAAPDGIETGIAAYEEIYARSWKVPEPFPRFNAEMMRQAAALGTLRLGLLHAHGRAVAAQIWIVLAGRATVLKLAHDEADKALSPGTVLTALMLRELIDQERVAELDFGRGDDAYKRLWVTRRRQHIGVVLINPLRPRGLAALTRQWVGAARRRIIPTGRVLDSSRKEDEGLRPLDPHQRRSLWNPLLQRFEEQGQTEALPPVPQPPLLKSLKQTGSKGAALSGVQGQSPRPFLRGGSGFSPVGRIRVR